jgi:xanthine dehydrogenase small subunit
VNRFILNDQEVQADLPPGMVLLDFIRYHKNLKGTKIGCREGDCGACTVLVGELKEGKIRYQTMTSCLVPLGNVFGKHIVTIEGVNMQGLNPVQAVMYEEGATQCGFCTPGFVMSMSGYCLSEKPVTEKNAIACIDGNICRCTGYKSIERAAMKLNEVLKAKDEKNPVSFVTEKKILPDYFKDIENRLKRMQENVSNNPAKKINSESRTVKQFVAGGTDLYVQRHDDIVHSEIDLLSDMGFLKGIKREEDKFIIGASTTVTELCESELVKAHFPNFETYAKLVSSTPIRNMATLAGNFVNASPIGDFTVFFLAMDATIVLSDGEVTREIPLNKFYKGYKVLDKHPNEYVQKLYFTIPVKGTGFNFEKVSKRTHLDIASVNSAMKVLLEGNKIIEASLSAGGVAPIPMYLMKASQFLTNKNVSAELINECISIAQDEISPISDARGSADYKRLLLSQMIKSHFLKLFPGTITEETILNL